MMTMIDEEGDYYRPAEVLERLRRGEERTFSSQEVRQDLGLDEPLSSNQPLTPGH
jgi:RHH-type transcriptional regulator, rel operon repressor / antitoxin RelB